MTDPIDGQLGALVMGGWIGEAPTGQEEAFLLLTTPDQRARVTMPLIADGLGIVGAPGSEVTNPGVWISIGADGWAALHVPGDKLERPVEADWAHLAMERGRVVLVIGYVPKPASVDAGTYAESIGGRAGVGLVPVR